MKLKHTILLMLLFTLTSCGDLTGDDNEIIEDRQFVTAEVDAALKICTALKDKRNYFELNVDGQFKLSHTVLETKCEATRALRTIAFLSLRVPFRGDIYWEGGRTSTFFRKVITEKSAPLQLICDDVLGGAVPRTVVVDGNRKYHFTFSVDKTFGTFLIKTYLKADDSDKFVKKDADASKVVISLDARTSNPRLYGVIVARDKTRDCADGRNTYRMRQTKN